MEVLLVHGLFMNAKVMGPMAKRLEKLNYVVHSFSYNSLNLEKSVDELVQYIEERNLHSDSVLVGHSLGGILIDLALQKLDHENVKVITLGTPHRGSTITKALNNTPFEKVLGTSKTALNTGVKTIDYILGAIVGTRNIGVGVLFGIKKGDGTVSSEDSIPPLGYTDLIEMDVTHTTMIYSQNVVEEIDFFIQNLKFSNSSNL